MRKLVGVVDDNQLSRLLLSDALTSAGYEVALYESAEDALAAIARELPLACIVDHLMPGMTGADFVRAIRRSGDERVRNMPIVGLSSKFLSELLDAGANSTLRKPFSDGSVTRAVEEAITQVRDDLAQVDALAALIRRFGELHDMVVRGVLEPSRVGMYRALRSEIARTLVTIQNLSLPPEEAARAQLRVAARLRADVMFPTRTLAASTTDLSAGGFSIVAMDRVEAGRPVRFRLYPPAGQPAISGEARIANVTAVPGGGHRVAVAFVRVSPEDAERVLNLVLDAVLARLRAPG